MSTDGRRNTVLSAGNQELIIKASFENLGPGQNGSLPTSRTAKVSTFLVFVFAFHSMPSPCRFSRQFLTWNADSEEGLLLVFWWLVFPSDDYDGNNRRINSSPLRYKLNFKGFALAITGSKVIHKEMNHYCLKENGMCFSHNLLRQLKTACIRFHSYCPMSV